MKCITCGHDICICDIPSEKDLQNWNEQNDYWNEGDEEKESYDNDSELQ